MKTYTKTELEEILKLHKMWLLSKDRGERADLRFADLRSANLRSANLGFADLRSADLRSAKNISELQKFFQNCPEQGDFIGWKKVRGNFVLKLLIKGKRVSPYVTRKCRTDVVKVLEAYSQDGKKTDQKEFISKYDSNFIYKIGRITTAKDYDPSSLVECSTGIYFCITKQEAIDW